MNTTGRANVTSLVYPDVRGKELMYLKIENNGREVLINVGKATFDQVTAILQPRIESTVINVLPKEEAKK